MNTLALEAPRLSLLFLLIILPTLCNTLLANNMLSGPIPVELTGLTTTFIFHGSSLPADDVSSNIISWKSLKILKSCSVPTSVVSFPVLNDIFDLSRDQFSGAIPPELGRLRLDVLDFSSDQLSIKIANGVENLAYESSSLNNPSLCASNPMSNLQSCSPKSQKSNKFPQRILALVLVLAAALFLVSVILTFFTVRDYPRKRRIRDVAKGKLTSFQRLDFTQANVLPRLIDINMIGSGGSGKVYKVPTKKSLPAQMNILPLPSLLPLLFLLITLPFFVISHFSPPAMQGDAVINLKQQLGNPPAYLTSLNSPCDLPEIHCSVTGIFLPDRGIGKEIPNTICDLKNLSRICFIATVPADVGIDNLACETSLLNNQSLCASNPMSNLQTASKFPPRILVLVLVLVAALLTLFTVRDYLRKRRIRDVATWRLTSFQRLNALSGLIDGNMVGSGGSGKVYKVPIGRSGEYVAVKRIWSKKKLDQNLEREFQAEVEIPENDKYISSYKQSSMSPFLSLMLLSVIVWCIVVSKASNAMLSGPIPVELTSLTSLTNLILDGNSLSGDVLPNKIAWESLNILNLARNKLSGPIPASISSLPVLNDLDLSRNQFSGATPLELGRLRQNSLVLSSNHLSSKSPDGFNNSAYRKTFFNNLSLSFSNPMSILQTCGFKSRKTSKYPLRILALVLVLAAALLTFSTVTDYLRNCLEFTVVHGSFRDVCAIIVFTVVHGDVVGILRSIWHLNIVKLLCRVSSDDTRLLVNESISKSSKSPFPAFVHFPVSSISTRKQICISRVNIKQKVKATVFSLMLFLAMVSCGDALKLLNEPGNKPGVPTTNELYAKFIPGGYARQLLNEPGNKPEVPATNEFLPGENSPSASTPAIEEGNLIDAKGSISKPSPGN